MTLGPALLVLSLIEKPLKSLTSKLAIFGRVAMFYYLVHILLIHVLAVIAALIMGYPEMIVLDRAVNAVAALKGYGFNLLCVYLLWVAHILILFPMCKWFDRYKRTHQSEYRWLSYL
jgi:hypothetical protein